MMDRNLWRQVQANVIAGLIVAAVVLVVGTIYSFLRSLSLSQFASYVVFPAAALGIVMSSYLIVRATLKFIARLKSREAAANARAKVAEDAFSVVSPYLLPLIAKTVIADAEDIGWASKEINPLTVEFTRDDDSFVMKLTALDKNTAAVRGRLGLPPRTSRRSLP